MNDHTVRLDLSRWQLIDLIAALDDLRLALDRALADAQTTHPPLTLDPEIPPP